MLQRDGKRKEAISNEIKHIRYLIKNVLFDVTDTSDSIHADWNRCLVQSGVCVALAEAHNLLYLVPVSYMHWKGKGWEKRKLWKVFVS